MKTSDEAKASGCRAPGVRHDPRPGLPPSQPSAAGQRRCRGGDIKRLKFARDARDQGLSPAAIRALLARLGPCG